MIQSYEEILGEIMKRVDVSERVKKDLKSKTENIQKNMSSEDSEEIYIGDEENPDINTKTQENNPSN